MGAVLRIVDETSTGELVNELTIELRLVSETMTARELVTRRIRAEVRRFNDEPRAIYNGLVQPTDTERVVNGYRMTKPRSIDEAKQIELAMKAFDNNGFLLLVGDEQVDDLDAEIVVREDTKVAFVRLIPLVGG